MPFRNALVAASLVVVATLPLSAQQPAAVAAAQPADAPANASAAVPLPAGYVIGPDDVLSIVFWRDESMSAEVRVRPDGMISLPLLNEVRAAGYTPEQLREFVTTAAAKYVEEPHATVVVKEINSRKVFVTGNVEKPGTYPLTTPMTVLQLIATAGGLKEYADADSIVIIRNEEGRQQYHKFNYKDVVKQKHVEQNILLKPGDTVVVP